MNPKDKPPDVSASRYPRDEYGVPCIGSHPWRAWWLGALDKNKREPRSVNEILDYFGLADFPFWQKREAEIAKLEQRYTEGFWGLVNRADEVNGPAGG